MPELPEVETVVRDLTAAGLVGRRIVRADVRWARSVAEPRPALFCRRIRGLQVEGLGRRGKYIGIQLSDGWSLLVHLRMTGQFFWVSASCPLDAHTRVVLDLDDGRRLGFRDTRKFGRCWLTRNPARILAKLGPEPLDAAFTARVLRDRLSGRHARLKPLLLNQATVAGLGNIYVDEALWDAGLHPERSAGGLSDAEVRRLHAAIRRVLRRGIGALGTSLGSGKTNFYSVAGRRGRNQDGLRVFRRTGMPCPRCGLAVQRIVVGQRSTHFCPQCQPPACSVTRRAGPRSARARLRKTGPRHSGNG